MLSWSVLYQLYLVLDTPSLEWVYLYQSWWYIFLMGKTILRNRSCYLIRKVLGGPSF